MTNEPNNDDLWDALDKLVEDRDREVSRLRSDLQAARNSHDMQQRSTLAFKRERDAVYLERNQVVAGLAALALKLGYPAGVAQTAIEGWDEEWHGCVYIGLPTGQVSWHFHRDNGDLFAFLSPYTGAWDGHDTPEKYRRVLALASTTIHPDKIDI